jgi:hypothetical protein
MLKALVLLAVESADAYRARLSAREMLTTALSTQAQLFADVEYMYTMDDDIVRLMTTSKFITLARIVRDNKAGVGALQWAIDALNTNLHNRQAVRKFFTRFSCKEGSALDDENKKHVHFNEKVLAKVLEILEPAQKEQTRR